MTERRWKADSRTLFAVFLVLALTITFVPPALAPPPGACEPWPTCRDGGGGGGGGDGMVLSFAPSNIVTLDQGAPGQSKDRPILLWQSVNPDNYEITWRSEGSEGYHDILIGDPDDDGEREIVAFTSKSVALSGGSGKGKKPGPTELRVLFHVFEAGSEGQWDAESPYVVVERNAWSTDGLIADIDGDDRNETVAIGSNSLAIFEHDPVLGYVVEFESGSQPVVLNDGDFGNLDGDPDLELVTGTNEGTVIVWDRQLDGSWKAVTSDSAPSPPIYKSRIGDIDGDTLEEVVGVSHDDDTGTTYISVWRHVSGAYQHDSTQALLLEGGATGWGFDLGDVRGDGKVELAMGTSHNIESGVAMVLAFDGTQWAAVSSTLTAAVTNEVWVGDADGEPSTVEVVFTGAKDGLYIEVFTWSAGLGAVSRWVFTGQFNPAWDSHIG